MLEGLNSGNARLGVMRTRRPVAASAGHSSREPDVGADATCEATASACTTAALPQRAGADRHAAAEHHSALDGSPRDDKHCACASTAATERLAAHIKTATQADGTCKCCRRRHSERSSGAAVCAAGSPEASDACNQSCSAEALQLDNLQLSETAGSGHVT